MKYNLLLASMLLISSTVTLAKNQVKSSVPSTVQVDITRVPSFNIRLRSINAESKQILEELEIKTGTVFHFTTLPEVASQLDCSSASIKGLVECLYGSEANLIIRIGNRLEQNSSKLIAEDVWIINSDSTTFPSCHDCGVLQKEGASAGNPSSQQKKGFLKPKQIVEWQKSSKVLSVLGDIDHDITDWQEALQEALTSNDPALRSQAIFAASRRQDDDLNKILIDAMHDKAASVRLMAVSNATDNIDVLNMALTDSDPNVRQLAELKLGSTAESRH